MAVTQSIAPSGAGRRRPRTGQMRSGSRQHRGEAGGGGFGFPPLLATDGRIHKGDCDMRIGAIFARGSCRALKWTALLGMVFAAGGRAGGGAGYVGRHRQGTVRQQGERGRHRHVHRDRSGGYVDAATDQNDNDVVDDNEKVAAATITVILSPNANDDPATGPAVDETVAADAGETADLNSNAHSPFKIEFKTKGNDTFRPKLFTRIEDLHRGDAQRQRRRGRGISRRPST